MRVALARVCPTALILSVILLEWSIHSAYARQESTQYASDVSSSVASGEVLVSAQRAVYDADTGVLTLSGDVRIAHRDVVLMADRVTWSQMRDTAVATGEVYLIRDDGEIMTATEMKLDGRIRTGLARNVHALLAGRMHLAAGTAEFAQDRSVYRRGVFTSCAVCKDEDKPPLWQVKSLEIVHDRITHQVVYRHAWTEIYGVPVLYMPYFRHPDSSVLRQSGFLGVDLGAGSHPGSFVRTPYYWVIDAHSDATITPMWSERGNVTVLWRRAFARGDMDVGASTTHERHRGHAHVQGNLALNRVWSTDISLDWSSDRDYYTDYAISDQDILHQRISFVGLKGRNSTVLQALRFQSMSPDIAQDALPVVAPWFSHRYVGRADRFGGSLGADFSGVFARRPNGVDTSRVSAVARYALPRILPNGQHLLVRGELGADLSQDHDARHDSSYFSLHARRIRPVIGVGWRYPLFAQRTRSHHLLQPQVQLVWLGDDTSSEADRAREEGNARQTHNAQADESDHVWNNPSMFDEIGLFSLHRFPGRDRLGKGVRLDYGLEWSGFWDSGTSVRLFSGGSLRTRTDRRFPRSSGLRERQSDHVLRGSISTGALQVQGRMLLRADNAKPRQGALLLRMQGNGLHVSAAYGFVHEGRGNSGKLASGVPSSGKTLRTSEESSWEELVFRLSSNILSDWSAELSLHMDTRTRHISRYASALGYRRDCLSLQLSYDRAFFRSPHRPDSTRVMLHIKLVYSGDASAS